MVYRGGRKYRKKRQQGKSFPIGLLASAAAPILGEGAKPLLKKIFGGKKRRRRWEIKYFFIDDLLQLL